MLRRQTGGAAKREAEGKQQERPLPMAMYHLRVKYVKRSEGRSAVAAAAYRAGDRLYDARQDKTHDYTRRRNVEHTEILLPEGAPEALRDRAALWNAVETGAKHPRAQPAIEVEVALPRELSKDECRALVREFAQEQFVKRGVAADIAIHRPLAADGLAHPHAHVLLSTRLIGPEGVGKTARDMQDNPKAVARVYALEQEGKLDEALLAQKNLNLLQWREAWARYANRALERSGEAARIDHRTLKAQQIAREPQPTIGLARYIKELTGGLRERINEFRAIVFRNGVRRQMTDIQQKHPHLLAEFIARARAYGQQLFPELTPNGAPENRLGHER